MKNTKLPHEHKQTILIASDHAGVAFKTAFIDGLSEWNWEDLGPFNSSSVDYPDYAEQVAKKVASHSDQLGILICGSGIGMCISANKIPGIRAAQAENPFSARLAREHNNANILCLGARILAPEYGIEIAKTWLTTPFSDHPKHSQRIRKIHSLEKA
jgi:ribose 5-phosphate isomerase B